MVTPQLPQKVVVVDILESRVDTPALEAQVEVQVAGLAQAVRRARVIFPARLVAVILEQCIKLAEAALLKKLGKVG